METGENHEFRGRVHDDGEGIPAFLWECGKLEFKKI
jgi:hypothetical protein